MSPQNSQKDGNKIAIINTTAVKSGSNDPGNNDQRLVTVSISSVSTSSGSTRTHTNKDTLTIEATHIDDAYIEEVLALLRNLKLQQNSQDSKDVGSEDLSQTTGLIKTIEGDKTEEVDSDKTEKVDTTIRTSLSVTPKRRNDKHVGTLEPMPEPMPEPISLFQSSHKKLLYYTDLDKAVLVDLKYTDQVVVIDGNRTGRNVIDNKGCKFVLFGNENLTATIASHC